MKSLSESAREGGGVHPVRGGSQTCSTVSSSDIAVETLPFGHSPRRQPMSLQPVSAEPGLVPCPQVALRRHPLWADEQIGQRCRSGGEMAARAAR